MKNKKILIIGIILILAIIIVAMFFIIKGKNKSGKTISENQTLNVKTSKADFNIKVESIDQTIVKGDILDDGDKTYTRVKVKVSNNSNSESVYYPFTNFVLLDSNDNELARAQIDMNTIVFNSNIDKSTLLPDKLEANQTVEGYLYFNETNVNNISKIKVSTPSKSLISEDGNKANVEYEYYFIKIK